MVREFGGHGIGLEFHEDPFVSHVSEPGTGMVLAPGCCFTIEPMINAGGQEIDMTDPNGWTVRTADRSPTAQWEVQLVITEDRLRAAELVIFHPGREVGQHGPPCRGFFSLYNEQTYEIVVYSRQHIRASASASFQGRP